jgi:hypothetical protein
MGIQGGHTISFALEALPMTTETSSVETFSALVGDLYTRWTLDGVTEIGYAVSLDMIVRPQLYQSNDIPDTVIALRMSYGTAVDIPNTVQRLAMMMPIFGRSDVLKPDASITSSAFHVARKKLIDAAIAFSERAVDTGIASLEDRVRSALVPLRSHFEGLSGKSFRLSYGQMKAESSNVIDLLTSPGIARVFGVNAADKAWPLGSNDPNGAKLVEAAGAALPLASDYKMGYTKFNMLQRVAVEGGRALTTALGPAPDSKQELPTLISQLYLWGTSLRDFQQTN